MFSFYIVGGGILLSIILSSVDIEAEEKSKFESIYYRHKNALYHQAMSIVKNEKDAEDVLQEAFIKIAKNLKSISDIKSKETVSFLLVITKNTAYDYIRKSSKIIELPLTETEVALDDSALSNLVSNIEYQEIVSIITSIPSPYNEVLYLHFVKDFSIKKTATLLDKKTATVKMQLVRGKKILIDKLSEVLYG